MSSAAYESLAEALESFQLDFPPEQVELLDRYRQLLWRWNEKLNLTRHTDFEKFVGRDVVDSWQLARLLDSGERVLDIGSGGGVPGAVLAILRPDLQVSMCESVGKKAQALAEIVADLDLPAAVFGARAEEVLQHERFDALTARAVGPMWKLLKWLQPHWKSFGRLLLIKGPRWPDERGEARHRGLMKDLQLRRAAVYPMSGTESESVILKVWPTGQSEPGPNPPR